MHPNRSIAAVRRGIVAAAVLLAVLVFTSPSAGAPVLVRGAAALAEEPAPQESAPLILPDPAHAEADRSRVIPDGCMVAEQNTSSGPCRYGSPNGRRALILYGDSHAMQYFPPLEAVAKAQGMRLLVLNKRECPPAVLAIRAYTGVPYWQCAAWRREAMRRIRAAGPGATVVMSGATDYTAYDRTGRALRGAANASAFEAGYVRALRQVQAAGLRAVVIRDNPPAPIGVPGCVAENRRHLSLCAFSWIRRPAIEWDVRAAAAVPGTGLIDVTPEVCPQELCRAVIGNALVFRDRHHLTATFARTLTPWIAAGLREAGAF